MGKSASGKDTIYKRLLNECPGLHPIVLYTTRPMRDGELQGVEYYFVSEKELIDFQDAGKIIELRKYQTMSGVWSYATIDNGKLGNPNSKAYRSVPERVYMPEDRFYRSY